MNMAGWVQDRWIALAVGLEDGSLEFDIENISSSRGPACCISAHIKRQWPDEWEDITVPVANQFHDLIMPKGYDFAPLEFTGARAARVIRKMLETGIVDWEGTP